MKKHITTILFIITLLAGLSLLLYPTVSDWWNSLHQSRAIAGYTEAVAGLDEESYEMWWEKARQYNEELPHKKDRYRMTEEEKEEYEAQLNVAGNGIMGYIEIPRIKCSLPVYHGTDEAVLQIAVGHMVGTSLPVGGGTSHCVLSGHRGLPSAKLFTDLDKVEKGDYFLLHILDETLAYEVDQITVVLPEEANDLELTAGKDYCTLVTCTPYGINSHRMLVRGHRVENIDDRVIVVTPDAQKIPTYYVIPAVGVPLLFIVLFIMLVASGGHKPKKTGDELLEEFKRNKDHK